MGDFFLDFRDVETRRQAASKAASLLRFCEDTRVEIIERPGFTLVLTQVDDPRIWGHFESQCEGKNILVAGIGRVAFEQAEWDRGCTIRGEGGWAAKSIFALYQSHGVQAFRQLNGHFVIILCDEKNRTVHLATDRFGMCLGYAPADQKYPTAYCSHPDVLAAILGEDSNWDRTSFAEFLMTGRLSFPHTYYAGVKALQTGAVHTFTLERPDVIHYATSPFFQFDFKIDSRDTDAELGDELAQAFTRAVRRRTLPILGTVGVSLSGGLDSRAILSAAQANGRMRAFTLFDEANAEFSRAKAIASACEIPLTPIKRDPEHYGSWAQLGVRISGGTGCIRSNHYLGVRRELREMGIQNLLTGCYCDYVFKALALNTRESALLRTQELSSFDFDYYLPCYWPQTPATGLVRERLQAVFPESNHSTLSEGEWLQIERKRTFPLAYEGDSAMRLIPQRVLPWYLPIADNDLMDVYLRIPSRLKLNAAVFRRMLSKVCSPTVMRVPDNNTGARIESGSLLRAYHRYHAALQNRVDRYIRRQIAVRGSWPNWEYFIHHSSSVSASWRRPNETARAELTQILGQDPFARPIASYKGRETELFSRIWTLKLWFDQRCLAN